MREQEDKEGNFSPLSNTNTTLSLDQIKAEEQLNDLLKEKERIDNDTTLDKKRKQNLKKKLRKKLKKAANKMINDSICDTEDNQDNDTERKFDIDKDNFNGINIDINKASDNTDLIPKQQKTGNETKKQTNAAQKTDKNDTKENNSKSKNESAKKDSNKEVLNNVDINAEVYNSVKKENNSKLINNESPYHVSKMNSTESNK